VKLNTKTRQKIELRLAALNLSFSSLSECLKIVLPSRSDLEKLSESHYSISHHEKELFLKRDELKKQNSEIEKGLQKIAKQGNFDVKSYHATKKERIQIGIQTVKDWDSNSSENSLNLVKQYQNLTNKESGFTDLILQESEAFVLYKELDHLKNKSHLQTQYLNELEFELSLQKR